MEWSDDKVIETIMDTHVKVVQINDRLDTHIKDADKKFKRLEKGEPLDRNWKYWTKKLGLPAGFLTFFLYMLMDLYRSIKGG